MSKMYTVIFKVDTNDADYLEESIIVSEERFLRICSILQKIKPLKRKVSPRIEDYDDDEEFQKAYKDVLTPEEIEELVEMIPVGDHGYATLESVKFTIGEPTEIY